MPQYNLLFQMHRELVTQLGNMWDQSHNYIIGLLYLRLLNFQGDIDQSIINEIVVNSSSAKRNSRDVLLKAAMLWNYKKSKLKNISNEKKEIKDEDVDRKFCIWFEKILEAAKLSVKHP